MEAEAEAVDGAQADTPMMALLEVPAVCHSECT